MTQDEKRCKIAEACGWKCVQISIATDYGPEPAFVWIHPDGSHVGEGDDLLPDYFHDLNAIAQAEKTLDTDQKLGRYSFALTDLCIKENPEPASPGHAVVLLIMSSAAIRAEAIGHALNLWGGSE